MSTYDLLYRRLCLFLGYLNDIGSFLSGHWIFWRSSSERFLRHKFGGSDFVNFIISSLQTLLLLGPATGAYVDWIHIVTWSSIKPLVATFSSQICSRHILEELHKIVRSINICYTLSSHVKSFTLFNRKLDASMSARRK